MGEFRMPSLGADMEAGKVIEWLVRPGDTVHRGDIVAVVDTDKADVDVEIFEDGVVEAILVPVGEKVAVGTPLARIAGAGAILPEPSPEREPDVPVPGPPGEPVRPAVSAPPVPAPDVAGVAGVVHSPLVRRRAAELGVDLRTVTGSGPDGTVTRADVERVASAPVASAGVASAPVAPPAPRTTGPEDEGEARRVSPRARRLAAEAGVELDSVAGSGPGGAVTGEDVERALTAPAPPREPAPRETATRGETPAREEAPPPATREATPEMARDRNASMRRSIANRMARANREIPHYYLETRIDLSRARAWLDEVNEARPVESRLIPAALLVKATALASRKVPELNGFWVDDHAEPAPDVNVGLVISLRGGGLVAPALHGTDTLALDDLMHAMRDVVGRARAGRLRSSEMSDPTITMTNIGEQGVDKVFGVIFPPQLAIVGFGAIRERPWAEDGMVGARPVVVATVAGDHRATDGATGARYLRAVDALLQEPEAL